MQVMRATLPAAQDRREGRCAGPADARGWLSEGGAIFCRMIDVELLERMRAAAHRAALDVVDDAAVAEAVAQDVVARLIGRGIADLVDPVAHAAAEGAEMARPRSSGAAA